MGGTLHLWKETETGKSEWSLGEVISLHVFNWQCGLLNGG